MPTQRRMDSSDAVNLSPDCLADGLARALRRPFAAREPPEAPREFSGQLLDLVPKALLAAEISEALGLLKLSTQLFEPSAVL